MRRVALAMFLGLVAVAAGCAGNGGGGEHVKIITDASFDTDITKGVVLVDFWAPW